MAKFDSILELVGSTPAVRINKLAPPGVHLDAKVDPDTFLPSWLHPR